MSDTSNTTSPLSTTLFSSVPSLLFRVVVAVVLIVLPLLAGWYAAWRLVLHKVPLFQELFGLKPKHTKKSTVTYNIVPPGQRPAATITNKQQRRPTATAATDVHSSNDPPQLRQLQERLAAATAGLNSGIRVQQSKKQPPGG